MSAALAASDPTPQAAADPEAEFHRQTLHDLTTWCADVAFTLRNAVETADTTDDMIRLAATFDAAARGVRRSIMLARHVARPPRPESASPTPSATRQTRPKPALRLAEVQEPAQDRVESPDHLDQPDPTPDTRPIPEQIAEIRNELEPAATPPASDRSAAASPPSPPWRATPSPLTRPLAHAATSPPPTAEHADSVLSASHAL